MCVPSSERLDFVNPIPIDKFGANCFIRRQGKMERNLMDGWLEVPTDQFILEKYDLCPDLQLNMNRDENEHQSSK